MRDQAATLAYASGYTGSSNPRAIELAERLAAICYPSINRFFFTSGGGEATESSIKMARAVWKLRGRPDKTKVISRINAYHGVTLAAMSATGLSPYWPLFEPRVPGFLHIPCPDPYRYEAPPGESQGSRRGRRARTGHPRGGAGDGRDVHRGAGAGRGRRDRAAGRLLPAHPRDLRPLRRPARRRRGDHRLRPHGPPLRPRPLGRGARHRAVRQGDHLGLLPVRRHRRERRDRGDARRGRAALDARLHLQRPSRRLRRRVSARSTSSRPSVFPKQAAAKGDELLHGGYAPRSPTTRMSATSAARA